MIILKNKATILFFLCALAGIALGVFFLIFGLKMGTPEDQTQYLAAEGYMEDYDMDPWEREIYSQSPGSVQMNQSGQEAATMVCKTIYICVGSVLAFVSTCFAAMIVVKLAQEEEENQAK